MDVIAQITTPLNLFLLIIIEFLLLFLVSRKFKVRLIRFIYKITRSRKAAIYLFSIIFLPGTYLHEIAHYMFALIMKVPAGDLELMPEFTHDEIKLGSVKIAKTDPIRRFFIGVAPLILGLFIIFFSIFFSYEEILKLNYVVIAIIGYVIFEIANTLFASRADMENFWEFFIIVGIFGGLLFYLSNALGLDLVGQLNQTSLVNFLILVSGYLFVPIIIDFMALIVIWFFEKVYDILLR